MMQLIYLFTQGCLIMCKVFKITFKKCLTNHSLHFIYFICTSCFSHKNLIRMLVTTLILNIMHGENGKNSNNIFNSFRYILAGVAPILSPALFQTVVSVVVLKCH